MVLNSLLITLARDQRVTVHKKLLYTQASSCFWGYVESFSCAKFDLLAKLCPRSSQRRESWKFNKLGQISIIRKWRKIASYGGDEKVHNRITRITNSWLLPSTVDLHNQLRPSELWEIHSGWDSEKVFTTAEVGEESPSLSIASLREKPHKRFSLSHFIALFVIPPSFILFIFTHFAFYIYISMKKSLNDFNVTATAQTARPTHTQPSI